MLSSIKFDLFQIEMFDTSLQMKNAREKLRGVSTAQPPINEQVPHFVIDVSSDGVQIFNNSENAECIPIMASVHSIAESPTASPTLLTTRYPIIVGIAHGHTKPTAKSLVKHLFQELKRLDPDNTDPEETKGRQMTVSVRCVVADWIFRSYLKRVKGMYIVYRNNIYK